MAEDANARIRIDIDTADALASIKNLQRQISAFHTSMAKSGAAATAASVNLQQGLLNSINRTGQFSATIKNVKTTTESFTNALEKNKLSMGEYFRYAGASTKTFGRLFKTEFDTINKVARERVKDLQTQYIKMGRDANGAMKAIAVRPLALDMENLATKTQIAAQRQALLNQLLKQGSTNLLNFGKNTQWAGRQLMVGFTVPLTMFASVAAKTFIDLEKQAIRFKRVYGEMFTTTEETNKALNEIRKLAEEFTKYGVAVADTMGIAADVAAMGKMGAELTAQVAESTRLAVLGGVEQQQALQATISVTDAFGTSAEKLASKINFLNAVENQTVTSIEDLTIAIPKAGPVVKQLGGDVEDLAFFLTAMREGGINASEGANALKSGLASLINPTEKAAQMLAGFGINIREIVNANKGNVSGIVVGFAKALDTLDPLNRAQAIEQLFGKFQFSRLSTLFQNVIREGNQASRVLKLANSTTEELAILSERELKKVEDSPLFKFQKAVEDIKVTLVPLGEAFLKAVTPILEFGTQILQEFNKLDEKTRGFIVGLTGVVGIIGPAFLMTFGLVANGVANIIKMFTFFKTTMNKAGSASQQLGVQVDYMTQQQLEAQAVAASLDQIHSKLRQTFTSEATAVNNLALAYQNAIAKQQAFMGMPVKAGGTTRGKTKGYADGVVSVPGPKGKGDVVPAMLSPGEAVIPADLAQRYAPLIAGMVSGTIPGYEKGLIPTYSNATMYLPSNVNEEMAKAGGTSLAGLKSAIKAGGNALVAPMVTEIAQRVAGTTSSSGRVINKTIADELAKNPEQYKKFATEFNKALTQELTDASKNGLKRVKDKDFAAMSSKALDKAAATAGIDKKIISAIKSETTAFGQKKESGGYSRRGLFSEGRTPYLKRGKTYQATANFLNNGKAFSTLGMHMAHLTETVWRSAKQVQALGTSTLKLGESAQKEIAARGVATKEAKKETAARSTQRKAIQKDTETTKAATKTTEKATKAEEMKTKRAAATPQRDPVTGRFTRSPITTAPETTATPAKARPRIGMGTIGAIGAVGLAGASMIPGPVGEMANQALMPAMIAASVLPMLKGPIGAVVAGLAAVTAGVLFFENNLRQASEEGRKLAEASTMTTEKLNALAEVTGTVSATEIRQRRDENQLTVVDRGRRMEGQALLESEAGKQILSDIEAQAKSGKNVNEIGRNIANQLATAIVQGVVTQEQAMGIASALGEELGSYAIPASISGRLVELLGRNGENLLESPLKVVAQIQQEAIAGQKKSFDIAQAGQQPTTTVGGTTRMAIGAGTFFAGGAMIASGVGIIPGVAAALTGAALMASALWEQNAAMAANNKLSAAALELGIEQVAQNQGYLDGLHQQYGAMLQEAQLRLDNAKTDEEKVAAQEELNRLQTEYKLAIDSTTKANADYLNDLIAQREVIGDTAWVDGINNAVNALYKDSSDAVKVFVEKAKEDLKSMEDTPFKAALEIGFASGEFDPTTVSRLVNAAGTGLETQFTLLIREQGTAEANQILQLLLMGNADDKTITTVLEFLYSDGKESFEQSQAALAEIVKMKQKYGITIDLKATGVDTITKVRTIMDALQGMKTPLTLQNIIDLRKSAQGTENAALWDQIYNNWSVLAGQDGEVANVGVLIDFTATSGSKDVLDAYYAATGKKRPNFNLLPEGDREAALRGEQGRAGAWLTGERDTKAGETTPTTPTTPSTTAGGTKESPFKQLLTDLKNLRLASINANGGMKELEKWFSGKKTITAFKGLETQLASVSNNTDFINFVTSLDAADQKLLFTIEKGNVKLTTRGKLVREAFNVKVIGDFVTAQNRLVSGATTELMAREQLVKAGYSYVEATELARDADIQAAYAAAIATEGKENQAKAIQAVNNAIKAGLDATQSVKTPLEQFNDIYGEFSDKLSADMDAINIKFRVDTATDQNTVRDAQSKIAALQYKIDDQEAGLVDIEAQEAKINDEYDARIEAAERLEKINDNINKQKQSELSLADALSSGDLAAAARAAQQIREEQAAAQAQTQREMLQKARDAALAKVTTKIGDKTLTRAEIEKQIVDYKKQIFDLEEQTLEPALERIRIAENERDTKLAALDAEKLKWDELKNKIDIAATAAKTYAELLTAGTTASNNAVNAIKNPESTVTTPPPVVNETPSGDGGTGSSGTGGAGGTGGTGSGSQKPPKPTGDAGYGKYWSYSPSQKKWIAQPMPTPPYNPGAGKYWKWDTNKDNWVTASIPPKPTGPAGIGYAWSFNEKTGKWEKITSKPTGTGASGGGGAGMGVRPLATGGPVSGPGTGTSDSIPAWLSNGEYVINAKAVKSFGKGFFDLINAQGFADGGYIGSDQMIGQGMKLVMDKIYAALFGPAMEKFRAGKAATGSDIAGSLGTVALNSLPIPAGKGVMAASKIRPGGINALAKVATMRRRSWDPAPEQIMPETYRSNKGMQLFGPGTYFSNKAASASQWREFGPNVQKIKLSPQAALKIAQSKGFKPLLKEQENMLSAASLDSGRVKQLRDLGYIGVEAIPMKGSFNNAVQTIFDLSTLPKVKLKDVGQIDNATGLWKNPTQAQKIDNAVREKLSSTLFPPSMYGAKNGSKYSAAHQTYMMATSKIAEMAKNKVVRDAKNTIKEKLLIRPKAVGRQIFEPEAAMGGYVANGKVTPKYFNVGGLARGTDIIPSMLTPGEFVMSRYAVQNYGLDKMNAINSGTYNDGSVYNYSVNVNVATDANPNDIARTVIAQIRQIDSQRIRGVRV